MNITLWLGRAALSVLVLAGTGCADVRRHYHYFLDMHYSPASDTAKWDDIGNRQFDMQEPDYTITYGGKPAYPYQKDVDVERASRELVAPANFDLKRGEKYYQIYCSPCHGLSGNADGPVAKKMPTVRKLVGQPAESYPLTRIYHIATVGQGTMKGYAPQVREEDRWNIAAYVKNELQKKK
ncbi:MAG: cytochrome c [Turneriella sp.]|nr:cytochrome c [Turneriella sp.]